MWELMTMWAQASLLKTSTITIWKTKGICKTESCMSRTWSPRTRGWEIRRRRSPPICLRSARALQQLWAKAAATSAEAKEARVLPTASQPTSWVKSWTTRMALARLLTSTNKGKLSEAVYRSQESKWDTVMRSDRGLWRQVSTSTRQRRELWSKKKIQANHQRFYIGKTSMCKKPMETNLDRIWRISVWSSRGKSKRRWPLQRDFSSPRQSCSSSLMRSSKR